MKTTKAWWKKLKKIQTHRKTSHVHGLEGVIMLNADTIPKVIYRFKTTSIQIPMAFFSIQLGKNPYNPTEWKTENSQINLEKEEQS